MSDALPIEAVRFVKELYPRLKEDESAIERYRAALDRLPPIIVAREDNVLVDGFHRWQAHRREGVPAIRVEHLGDLTDAEILDESIRRNAAHGTQLTRADKQDLAKKRWVANGTDLQALADLLSVSRRAVELWTKDLRDAEQAAKKERAWQLWLAGGMTQEQIADETGLSQQTVSRLTHERKLALVGKAPASLQDFDIWRFATDSEPSGYFGKMPTQAVENLLWFYSDPDLPVVDLFAGTGTTIDVGRRMGRTIYASDLHPARLAGDILEHDAATGWPPNFPDAGLILLDPPYWKQAEGRYSQDPRDLGNQSLDEFLANWMVVVQTSAEHLADNGRLAFIVSPAQDGTLESGRVVDLAFEMYRIAADEGLICRRRIIVPYSTQQATGQQIDAARKHRRLLKLYRDLVVLSAP